jgi:hypothetical protein
VLDKRSTVLADKIDYLECDVACKNSFAEAFRQTEARLSAAKTYSIRKDISVST